MVKSEGGQSFSLVFFPSDASEQHNAPIANDGRVEFPGNWKFAMLSDKAEALLLDLKPHHVLDLVLSRYPRRPPEQENIVIYKSLQSDARSAV